MLPLEVIHRQDADLQVHFPAADSSGKDTRRTPAAAIRQGGDGLPWAAALPRRPDLPRLFTA